jgi:hypothetical protein
MIHLTFTTETKEELREEPSDALLEPAFSYLLRLVQRQNVNRHGKRESVIFFEQTEIPTLQYISCLKKSKPYLLELQNLGPIFLQNLVFFFHNTPQQTIK